MNFKKTLVALGIFALPFASKAQDVVPIGIDLGVKAGMNFSSISGDYWNTGYKANWVAGVFAGIEAKRIGVVAEGLFSQAKYTTGSNFHRHFHHYYNDNVDSAAVGSFKVNQLSIPLLLRVKLFPMVWLQLGPQYSTVVSVKDGDALLKDASNIFKQGDVAGVGGLELKLPLGFRVTGRYIMGLTDVNNTTVADAWKQRAFQLSVGYSFL